MEKIPPYPNSLRRFIEGAGYSFKEVAKKAHTSERTLYYWVAGQRGRATLTSEIGGGGLKKVESIGICTYGVTVFKREKHMPGALQKDNCAQDQA